MLLGRFHNYIRILLKIYPNNTWILLDGFHNNFHIKIKCPKGLKREKSIIQKEIFTPLPDPLYYDPPTPSSSDPSHDALHTKCSKKYWDTMSSHKAISEYPISNEICLFVHHFKAIQNFTK